MHRFANNHPNITGVILALILFVAITLTLFTMDLPEIAGALNIGAAPDRSWTPPVTATPTPTITPTPASELPTTPTLAVALPPDLPTPAPGRWAFQPGDVAVNVNNGPVNLRKTPGYKDKPASDRIALVPAGARVRILHGPALADGLVWWYVDWNGRQGWMAERRASGAVMLAPEKGGENP